jgi:small GTP-binding protein
MATSTDTHASPDAVLKIKLAGDSNVGKTSILLRYVEDKFVSDVPSTVGVDYKSRITTIKGKVVKMVLWDTAGQEKYRTLIATYYKGAHGFCFVFDVTDRKSFENVDTWFSEMQQHLNDSEGVVKMLIANKIDLEGRVVSKEEGETVARKHSMLYIETSAKTNKGITDAFTELATQILESNPSVTQPHAAQGSTQFLKTTTEKQENKAGCC